MQPDQHSVDDLICPVCCDIMEAPIRTCVNGHNICNNCFNNVTICPLCRDAMKEIRNFKLENFGRSLIYKCTNDLDGCNFQSTLDTIKDHNKFCKFSITECPLKDLNPCKWTGKIENVMDHCLSRHPNNSCRAKSQTLLCYNFLEVDHMHLTTLKRYSVIIEACGQIFKIVWGLNCSSGWALWKVICCGSIEDASKYRFSLDFKNPVDAQDKLHLEGHCESTELPEIVSTYTPILQKNLVKYCSGVDLYYTITINKFLEEEIHDQNSATSSVPLLVPEGCMSKIKNCFYCH